MANRKTPRGGKAWALRGVFYMARRGWGMIYAGRSTFLDAALRLRALELCGWRARLAGATEAEIEAVIAKARGVKRD